MYELTLDILVYGFWLGLAAGVVTIPLMILSAVLKVREIKRFKKMLNEMERDVNKEIDRLTKGGPSA